MRDIATPRPDYRNHHPLTTTQAATKALEELDQLRADLAGQPSSEDADERS